MTAALAARNRPQLSFWWLLVSLIAALAVATWSSGPLAFLLVQQLPFDWLFAVGAFIPTLVMALLGLLAVGMVIWAYDRAARRHQLRYFAQLGIPLEIEGTYEIRPEGFCLTTERIKIVPVWQAIDTVNRVHDGWVISADQLTFFLASDSFADVKAEQAFLALLVAHLSPMACARSPEACQFSGQA